MTGILGWIIRITLLLLKNTRSRGEYQRQAGSGRPSQPTSWPVNACGCQGSTFLIFSFPRCFRSGSRVGCLRGASHQKGMRAAPPVSRAEEWVRVGGPCARRRGGRGKEGLLLQGARGEFRGPWPSRLLASFPPWAPAAGNDADWANLESWQ